MIKQFILSFCCIVLCVSNYAQQEYPRDYFSSPVDIPIFLAGNFGEIRSGHFHAGLDIKTEGVEGKNILAAADGYVSRIKISEGGYGKALYITHPNGYTTTYAHLQKFNNKIEAIVKKAQYQKESYEVELFLSKEEIKVTKGEVVATSGNTGGSGGPHLHFEIRETESEIPVNPLLFGFNIKDDVKPSIKALGIYPIDNGSIEIVSPKLNTVTRESALLYITGNNDTYNLNAKLKANGKIGLGIEVQDNFTGSSNRCGAYSIELLIDSASVYCHEMNRIGFFETRYINSHVCYEHWKKDNHRIQRSYVQPNNKLDVYACDRKNHVFEFNDNKTHHFTYIVRDANMNTAFLEFDIESLKIEESNETINSDTNQVLLKFNHNKPNNFENENVKIEMPANILYDDINFTYKQTQPKGRAITPIHHIHNTYTPLHAHMKLSIKADSIKEKYKEKALIVALDEDFKFLAAEGGELNNNWITIKTRSLGPYTVMIDSVAPSITPINISNGKDMSAKWSIMMKINDELSGIQSYRGTIDGNWVLFEYDYKQERLTYMFDETKLTKGQNHNFKLVVTDKRNNINEYNAEFFW